MRRLLCMVLTGAVMIGCLCTGTGAVDESNVVSKEYETTGTAITRATGNLDWTIKANGTVVADTSFTMSAGETVRIRANYSPENASLDFGLVDSNEKFHYPPRGNCSRKRNAPNTKLWSCALPDKPCSPLLRSSSA